MRPSTSAAHPTKSYAAAARRALFPQPPLHGGTNRIEKIEPLVAQPPAWTRDDQSITTQTIQVCLTLTPSPGVSHSTETSQAAASGRLRASAAPSYPTSQTSWSHAIQIHPTQEVIKEKEYTR